MCIRVCLCMYIKHSKHSNTCIQKSCTAVCVHNQCLFLTAISRAELIILYIHYMIEIKELGIWSVLVGNVLVNLFWD